MQPEIMNRVFQGATLVINDSAERLFAASGIEQAELELVCQPLPWASQERSRVKNYIETLVYGTMDVAGLTRFDVPAEYMAAIIVNFVDPINYMVACDMFGNLKPSNIEQNETGVFESVTRRRLFALCVSIKDDEYFKHRLAKVVNSRQEKAKKEAA